MLRPLQKPQKVQELAFALGVKTLEDPAMLYFAYYISVDRQVPRYCPFSFG